MSTCKIIITNALLCAANAVWLTTDVGKIEYQICNHYLTRHVGLTNPYCRRCREEKKE